MRAALADRLTLTDAVEIVGKLLAAFPNGAPQNSRGYIGALATTLCEYPRVVALKCADIRQGVARETRFLPTVADVVAWCEREKAGLQQIVDRDDFNRARAREAEERKKHEAAQDAARQARPTLQEMKDKYGENWGINAGEKEDEKVRAARLEVMARANATGFERECRAAGVDPNRVASPSLERLLHGEIRMRRAERLGAEIDRIAEQQAAE